MFKKSVISIRSTLNGIVIGNDVWIGNSVTIMPGIKIGHGAII
jgi:acetyltransferase-like isoleucine patch superfamily enzyme